MGSRGPIPKRDSERRRRNKPAQGTDTVHMPGKVTVPAADPSWHPLAKSWYRSLRKSGQSVYFEPSDWATAKYTAELMSRLLNQTRGVSAELVKGLNALMASLMTTEGDRRRVRLEIERGGEEEAVVTPMDAYRRAKAG